VRWTSPTRCSAKATDPERISALAAAGEVLVTSVVRALVPGSCLSFVDRGVHSLKGVPDTRQLFAVA
jgi:hypothetical protein